MEKLKVGIIGTGWIADAHAQKYKMMEDVEVVALADLIPGKAEKFAENEIPYDYVHLKDSDHSLLQNPIKHLKFYQMLFYMKFSFYIQEPRQYFQSNLSANNKNL